MTELQIAASRGQLQPFLERRARALKTGIRDGVQRTTRVNQLRVRDKVNRAFPKAKGGRRSPGNAIRSALYENEDGWAGQIYSKFGRKEGGVFVDYLLLHQRAAGFLRAAASIFSFLKSGVC